VRYLLDTNVISERVKPRPDEGVVRWLHEIDEDRTYLSVLTIGELRKGMERLVDSARRKRLRRWLAEDLQERFRLRLLPVDVPVADAWGRLLARCDAAGTPVGGVDGLIAAIAIVHRLIVVTRNVAHFRATGVDITSPWR
jgi:predicted nucleic acid-binding protein